MPYYNHKPKSEPQDAEKLATELNQCVELQATMNTVYEDGIFVVGKRCSKTYRFDDINYSAASREDKEAMFLEYSELLNSLDSGATTKITVNNCRINRNDFEKTIFIWKKVLAVYAVKTNTDTDNAQDVAKMDDKKKELLRTVFGT